MLFGAHLPSVIPRVVKALEKGKQEAKPQDIPYQALHGCSPLDGQKKERAKFSFPGST